MNILIMGRPGAGKGTQAALIKKHYNIPHISTGDMFRQAIFDKSKLGVLAKSYIDKGQLVPDEVTIDIIKERLANEDCKGGFLLDGFPRTIAQAIALDEMLLEQGTKIDKVLDVDAPVELLVSRMTGRRICPNCGSTFHIVSTKPKTDGICDECSSSLIQRADDNEATALDRLKVYDNQTAPLIDYYSKKRNLFVINGQQETLKVFEDIKDILGN